MTAPRQEKGGKAAPENNPIAEPLASASKASQGSDGIEDLVAALRSRVKDDAGLYKACGLKSPEEVGLGTFEPWAIADAAVEIGWLPPPEHCTRDQALRYLRDAARAVTPALGALERHDFLSDIGFIADLEQIEAALVAGRSFEALYRLRRFIRPVWMAAPAVETARCGHGT